jgi:hypothetical protein
MSAPEKVVTCACGWAVQGDDDTVIAATRLHGRDLHNMEATDEQILAMARPSTP